MEMDIEERMGLLISRYMDNELSEDEHRLVDDHCLICIPCRDTLEIFTKNEKVLNSTLCGEIFENMIIEGVMRKVAKKNKTGNKHKTLNPFITVAGLAAAVLVVATFSYISSLYNMLQDDLKRLYTQNEELLMHESQLFAKYNDLLRNDTVRSIRSFLANSKEPMIAGYVEGDTVVVQASFENVEKIAYYSVFKRKKGDLNWRGPLNGRPLLQPEYFDVTTPVSSRLSRVRLFCLCPDTAASISC